MHTEGQNAFESLKTGLLAPPHLGHLNLDLLFIVNTDVSETVLGAVLRQKKNHNSEEVLASRSFN